MPYLEGGAPVLVSEKLGEGAQVEIESKVLIAADHVLVSTVESMQSQLGVNLGSTCTAPPWPDTLRL